MSLFLMILALFTNSKRNCQTMVAYFHSLNKSLEKMEKENLNFQDEIKIFEPSKLLVSLEFKNEK